MRYKNALGTDEFKMLDDIQKDLPENHQTTIHHPSRTCRTGKTTVMAAVMTAAMAAESAVKCLAPTHKAKNNLKLRVPKEAETATIHSFNKRKAAKLPLRCSLSTGSMVDVELLDSP
jgi:hypothetical protein